MQQFLTSVHWNSLIPFRLKNISAFQICDVIPAETLSLWHFPSPTYHSSSVSLHKLNNASRVLVPQVDVTAVTAADHKLTAWTVEVHTFYCETDENLTKTDNESHIGQLLFQSL